MTTIRLQDILAGTSAARLLLHGMTVSGDNPLHPRLRCSGLTISGAPAILTDVYAHTGTDWKPAPPVTWEGSAWR